MKCPYCESKRVTQTQLELKYKCHDCGKWHSVGDFSSLTEQIMQLQNLAYYVVNESHFKKGGS